MSGFAGQLGRVEELVAALENAADPALQATARELLQSVLELHRQGISRMLELAGEEAAAAFARDDLVGSLLLLHDLHPLPLEPRLRAAVERARPELAAEGCTVELIELREGVARVRLERPSAGHHATAKALRAALEDTLWALAPDAAGIEIEGFIAPARTEAALVQLGIAAP